MSELSTLARPYAEAIFSLAREQGQLGAWAQVVERLGAVAADDSVLELAMDPRVTPAQLAGLLQGLVDAPQPEGLGRLIEVMVENHRVSVLGEVAVQFRALRNTHEGTADALIETAFPLDDAHLESLKGVLERRFGLQLNTTVIVNPKLIGGVRVTVGDKVLDTSVQARLEGMRSALLATA
jgi:F-type H+-transporting ATPase subunit delta